MKTFSKQSLLTILALLFISHSGNSQSLDYFYDIISNQDAPLDHTIKSISIAAHRSTNIPVTIRLEPAHYLHGKGYVATNTSITAIAEIEDAKFKNSSFAWFTKGGTITNASSSHLVYQFTKPEDDNFLKVLVADKSNTGVSQKNLIIRNPVQLVEPVGKTNIEHGELINLSFKFNGSGPFNYCYKFCYESDHDPACERCNPDRETILDCVNITHYMALFGNYSLLFNVDNIASQQEKRITIRISETVKKHCTHAYVPIIASISGVLILLIGVGLHLKFKRTVYSETADFDFTRTTYYDEEEWDQEQSFVQRVIYLLFSNDESGQGNLLNTSSLSDSRIWLF